MTRYRNDPSAVRALVRADSVHRDVYVDRELFDLEMEQLWRNAWIFVGHDSQVPLTGDFYSTSIGREPVILIRGADGRVRVLSNRCAHKGTKLVSAVHGKCPGSMLRSVPLKGGYDGTGFEGAQAARGLPEFASVNYRGFVFTRLAPAGIDFQDYFGDSLSSIDNLVDRAPEGRLEVAGGVLRYLHDCNWKMFVENLNDAMHPMVAHESSAGTAKRLWQDAPPDAPKPMVIEQFTPFVNDYDFFDKMGVKLYDNGHSYTGVNFSIHSRYSSVGPYRRAMIAAYGEASSRQILDDAR